MTATHCSIMVALWNRADRYYDRHVIGQAIIFLPCGFFYLSIYLLFFPRLISAVAERMSTILLHMAWP